MGPGAQSNVLKRSYPRAGSTFDLPYGVLVVFGLWYFLTPLPKDHLRAVLLIRPLTLNLTKTGMSSWTPFNSSLPVESCALTSRPTRYRLFCLLFSVFTHDVLRRGHCPPFSSSSIRGHGQIAPHVLSSHNMVLNPEHGDGAAIGSRSSSYHAYLPSPDSSSASGGASSSRSG